MREATRASAHYRDSYIPPVASTLRCPWIARLNFLGSNDQKQSVVRRCTSKICPHLHCPLGQVYGVKSGQRYEENLERANYFRGKEYIME